MPSFGMFQVTGLGRSHQRAGQWKRASFLVECFRLKLPVAFFRLLYIHCLDDEALICVFLCGFLASCFFHWNIYIPCVCFTYFYLRMHHHQTLFASCMFWIRTFFYDFVYLSKASSLVLFVEGDANTWTMQPRSKVEAYRAASTGWVDDRQDHVCPLALVYFCIRGPRRGVLLMELKM